MNKVFAMQFVGRSKHQDRREKSGMIADMTTDEIRTAAMKLDPVERESLAEELLLSISDSERDRIDAAWLTEVYRRDADYAAGKTGAKPVFEVIDRMMNRKPR